MFKFWLAPYFVMLLAVVGSLFVLRSSVLAEMGTPAAEAEWKQWKAEASKQEGTAGPVQRSVPKSNEPPLLTLMRDYFAASMVGLLLPLSALYWFIAWLIVGVTRQSRGNEPNKKQ